MRKFIVLCLFLTGITINIFSQGNDLYNGISQKLSYKQMIIPYGVQVTFFKTTHIIFPSAIKYVDLGSSYLVAGKAEAAENVLRIKAAVEFIGETNFSVLCEDGVFYSFNVKYAREPEFLNIEMQDFLRAIDSTSNIRQNKMSVRLPELGNVSPEVADLVMKTIYKNNPRPIRHLGCKRFGIQMLVRGIYIHDGMYFILTSLKNTSNVPFVVDFIKFKVIDKKLLKRTAIQETVISPVKTYNEQLEIVTETVRSVYALPRFTIPDDKILIIELYEKNGARHQEIRVENIDLERAKTISKLKP